MTILLVYLGLNPFLQTNMLMDVESDPKAGRKGYKKCKFSAHTRHTTRIVGLGKCLSQHKILMKLYQNSTAPIRC